MTTERAARRTLLDGFQQPAQPAYRTFLLPRRSFFLITLSPIRT